MLGLLVFLSYSVEILAELPFESFVDFFSSSLCLLEYKQQYYIYYCKTQ
jgi:hypothetical protein